MYCTLVTHSKRHTSHSNCLTQTRYYFLSNTHRTLLLNCRFVKLQFSASNTDENETKLFSVSMAKIAIKIMNTSPFKIVHVYNSSASWKMLLLYIFKLNRWHRVPIEVMIETKREKEKNSKRQRFFLLLKAPTA